jgi:hypothetical protein
MNIRFDLRAAPVLGALLVGAISAPLDAKDPSISGKVIPLPDTDRAVLEQYFGSGVIGEPIEALPISNPTEYIGLEQTQTEWIRRVHGNDSGKVSKMEITALDRPGRVAWKLRTSTEVLFGEQDGSGNLVQHSSQDTTQSVLSRYDPPEPLLVKGMDPGSHVRYTVSVGVYDLSNPKNETHSGALNMTYTYIGAYKVTVPAGTYDAVLFRWDYNGKVGPATVQDSQYWFLAKGIGPVATVNRKDISAFLIYNDDSKVADVLTKRQD